MWPQVPGYLETCQHPRVSCPCSDCLCQLLHISTTNLMQTWTQPERGKRHMVALASHQAWKGEDAPSPPASCYPKHIVLIFKGAWHGPSQRSPPRAGTETAGGGPGATASLIYLPSILYRPSQDPLLFAPALGVAAVQTGMLQAWQVSPFSGSPATSGA